MSPVLDVKQRPRSVRAEFRAGRSLGRVLRLANWGACHGNRKPVDGAGAGAAPGASAVSGAVAMPRCWRAAVGQPATTSAWPVPPRRRPVTCPGHMLKPVAALVQALHQARAWAVLDVDVVAVYVCRSVQALHFVRWVVMGFDRHFV